RHFTLTTDSLLSGFPPNPILKPSPAASETRSIAGDASDATYVVTGLIIPSLSAPNPSAKRTIPIIAVTNDEFIWASLAAKSNRFDVGVITDVAATRKRTSPMTTIIAPMAVRDPRPKPNSDPSSLPIRITGNNERKHELSLSDRRNALLRLLGSQILLREALTARRALALLRRATPQAANTGFPAGTFPTQQKTRRPTTTSCYQQASKNSSNNANHYSPYNT